MRWAGQGAYRLLGLFAIVVGGGAALLIDGAPERHGFAPDGGLRSADAAAPPAEGMGLGETVRSRPFVLLYLASFAVSLGLFMPFVHLAPFAEDRGVPHATAVTLFTLVGVGSTLGRFALGGVADRFGRRRSLAGMYLGIALMFAWWLIARNAWQIGLFAFIFGTCYGGYVALSPALIVDYFGGRNASGIIGLSYTSVALGTLAGPPLAGYAFDLFGSYTLPIAASAVTALVGVALVALAPEPERFARVRRCRA
jgi:MFS family permease